MHVQVYLNTLPKSIPSNYQSRTFTLAEEGLNVSARLHEDDYPVDDDAASPALALTADDQVSEVSFRESAYATGGESDEEEVAREILEKEEKKEVEEQRKKQARKTWKASRMMVLLGSGGKLSTEGKEAEQVDEEKIEIDAMADSTEKEEPSHVHEDYEMNVAGSSTASMEKLEREDLDAEPVSPSTSPGEDPEGKSVEVEVIVSGRERAWSTVEAREGWRRAKAHALELARLKSEAEATHAKIQAMEDQMKLDREQEQHRKREKQLHADAEFESQKRRAEETLRQAKELRIDEEARMVAVQALAVAQVAKDSEDAQRVAQSHLYRQKWREAATTSLEYKAEEELRQRDQQEVDARLATEVKEGALKRKKTEDDCAGQKAGELEDEAVQEAPRRAVSEAKKKLLALKVEDDGSSASSQPASPVASVGIPLVLDEAVERNQPSESPPSESSFLTLSLEKQQAILEDRKRVGAQEAVLLTTAEATRIQRQNEESIATFTPRAGDPRSSVGDIFGFEEATMGKMPWPTEEDVVVIDTIGDAEFEHQAELALSRMSASEDPQAEEEWSGAESIGDDDSFVSA